MRRLTAWIGGVAAGVVAYRFWRRRPQASDPQPPASQATAEPPPPEPTAEEADERADELRAKLAESRESDEPSPAEPDEPDEPPKAVEERRQRVHDEGRAALDEMHSDDAGPTT
jgi:hypothetical protein